MSDKIKISVVTVCYNAVSTIEQTILSVINQTYSNIEYIIIDGGSTDGTVDIIKKYTDKIAYWISEPDKGIYDAMNKGIDKASGEWINFMNAGDSFYESSTIESFISKVSPNTDIAYGDTMVLMSVGRLLKRAKDLNLIMKGMVFGHQATFVKMRLMKKTKFDVSFRSSGDYNFLYQMYQEGYSFEYIHLIIANYDGEQGMSLDNWFTVKKEDARIQGKNKSLHWAVSFYLEAFVYEFRKAVKWLLPHKLVLYFRKIKLERIKRIN